MLGFQVARRSAREASQCEDSRCSARHAASKSGLARWCEDPLTLTPNPQPTDYRSWTLVSACSAAPELSSTLPTGIANPIYPRMANRQHLDTLRQGIEVWNRWREQNPGVFPDLSHADLKGMVLRGANLARVNLKGADLRKTTLENTNFSGADLRGVNLQQAGLRKADLSKANLNRANLRQTDLRGANLAEASMVGAELGQANLQGAILRKKGPRRAEPGESSIARRAPATSRERTAPESVVPPVAKRRRLLLLVLGTSIAVAVGVGLAFLRTPQLVQRQQVQKTVEQPQAASISEVEATLTEALTAGWELQSITTEDGIMSIRLNVETIPSDEYYAMMTAACRAIDPLGDTPTSLREMKFLPAPGRQGWVYTAPHNCRQIVRTPANLVRLRIAANTTAF